MPNIVPLNNVHHKNLKIKSAYSEYPGKSMDCVVTFPTEFAQIQREYPIFFQKHPDTGQYQSIALLGLAPGENLFLQEGKWRANYIPAIVACDPFIIGFEDQTDIGGTDHEPIIYVNMDSPRISDSEGEAVFREFGGNSPYLEKVIRNLHALYHGQSISDRMFSIFTELDLIEPVKLEIKLNNSELFRLHGNYTISSEKLASLDGESLAKLNHVGALECAFFVATSLNNVQHLIDTKNARR